MATIGRPVVLYRSDANDKVMRLSGTTLRRKLDGLNDGGAWNVLRVGVRCRLAGADVNTSVYGETILPRFGIGLCNKAGDPIRDASAGHFAGAVTTSSTWTVISPGAGDFYFSFNMAPGKQNSSGLTTGTNFGATIGVGTGTEPTPVRLHQVCLFVDITKGSPDYSMRLFSISNASNGGGNSRAQWETQMEADPPSLVNYVYQAAQTVAVDEGTDGELDSLCIFHQLPIEMEIWDLGVVKFS
jgi:hypothetical protein